MFRLSIPVRSLGVSFLTLLTLLLFVAANQANACIPTIKFANWQVPATGTGPNFTQTWGLINIESCPVENYTLGNPQVYQFTASGLVPYSGSVNGTYSTFSLAPNGGTGSVTANFTFALPPEGFYRIFFDVIMDNGQILPHFAGASPPGYGRLNTDVGMAIAGCFAPMPSVNFADHVDLGNGEVAVSVEVENAAEDPTLDVSGSESDMKSGSNGNYTGGDNAGQGDNTNTVEVVGECDMSAFLEYQYLSFLSSYYGKGTCTTDCWGC